LPHPFTTFTPLLGYTSDVFDKHGRAIIYLKIGRNVRLENSETYLSLLMYTVERWVLVGRVICCCVL
jgi:hypothetical protein